MPCNSDHLEPTARELESKKVMAFLGEVGLRKGLIPSYGNVGALNEHTAQLCKFCQENDVSEYSLELQIWWRNHQAADKRKAEIKLAKNKEEKEKRAAYRPTLREHCRFWRNDAFEAAAKVCERYGQHDAARDIRALMDKRA